MKHWHGVLLAAAIVGVVVVPAAVYGQNGTDRPFKASFTGTTHWEWPGLWPSSCAMVTTVADAVGQASHLGRTTLASSHCPAEPAHVLDGWLTLTAANGDTLIGRYDYDPASTSPTGVVTWAGGTGRFAEATGGVLMTFQVVPVLIPGCTPSPDPFPCYDFSVAWPWSATLVGTITY